MKLPEHVENIRQLIDQAFRNRLGRMGIIEGLLTPTDSIPQECLQERKRMEDILEVFIAETGTAANAFEKLVEELTFTLFNRLAALKVMEAHTLHPEIITRRESHGGRSFAHLAWLEQNHQARSEDAEGLLRFLEEQLQRLAGDIPLFSPQYPYHLLPTAFELLLIIEAFNNVDNDPDILKSIKSDEPASPNSIWQSDDVLGWLYESYNNYKKAAHKASGGKTEYNKVSIQSQVYTPRWVVQFLVDNSLGKLYLEMYPESDIKNRYKIANAPATQTHGRKPIHEIKLIDPATGSGNFLLYAFDLFYDLYIDQIESYGADYYESDIPKLIIENNLYGIDLDDRAIQLAQLGLYIKAKRKKRSAKVDHFNIVSSDFYLPDYHEVAAIFEDGTSLDKKQKEIIRSIWTDLQQAYKFGSLIRLEEKLSIHLHGLQQDGLTLFSMHEVENYENFRDLFFAGLQQAVTQNTERQGHTFLNTKTQDAITFLQLLTQKYDVAVANPPYTDSADFGTELKEFIDTNYKQPLRLNNNLYVTFIKKCYDLTTESGYIAMIHPFSFMFIKTFEDVRKLILEKTHIDLLVDFGLDRVNLFDGGYASAPTFYILSKQVKNNSTAFFKLTDSIQEKDKKVCFEIAFNDYISGKSNDRLFTLEQDKLKIIKTWPFIYWISDGFRVKFKGNTVGDIADVRAGIQTSNNNRFLRLWWEVNKKDIIFNEDDRGKKRWAIYSKGGPYNKWHGNLWCIIDWKEDGIFLQRYLHSVGQELHAQEYYFKKGITYSALGKGSSFRYFPPYALFDIGGSSVFLSKLITNNSYLIGLFNSKLTTYITNCLNPTVNVQPQDLKRIPFVSPTAIIEKSVSSIADKNIEIKQNICTYHITETNFSQSPLTAFTDAALRDRVLSYLCYENAQLTRVLINEAIINELIFEVYELSAADREQVEAKMGKSIGQLPITNEELGNGDGKTVVDLFIEEAAITDEVVLEHLRSLPLVEFEPEKIRDIKDGFATLYQSNNDLEEFCIRHQVNPINVWYWFREANVMPQARAAEIALEFLADAIRTLLQDDEDGIIPLVGLPGEDALSQRLEQHCLSNGFTTAQYMQFEGLLGRPINDYLENHFFRNLSDHLNLFMYLPKTPFIWHLSSGEHQGFEAYILIYKWDRDSLFKLKSQYISHRVQNIEYRQIQLLEVNTAQAQSEKEKIRYQLQEIELFKTKIDELIAEGYNPKLDDGVGKNIAPLQKKGLLRAEVLKSGGKNSQLDKYLNADW